MTDGDQTQFLDPGETGSNEQVSYLINRIKSKLMFTRNKSAQFAILEELDLQLRKYDGDRKRLLRETISRSHSSPLSTNLQQGFSFSLHLKGELSELFQRYSDPKRKSDLIALGGEAYQAEAERLAVCYQPHLLSLLEQEEAIIQEQLQCFSQHGLSKRGFATPIGKLRYDLQNSSRDQRRGSYDNYMASLERDRQVTHERFLDLHKIRRELADKAGFRSFEEYQIRRLGVSDMLHDAIPTYHKLVRQHFLPLASTIRFQQAERLDLNMLRPWDYFFLSAYGTPELDADSYPLAECFLSSLEEIIEKQLDYFVDMNTEGNLQIKPAPSANESDLRESRLSCSDIEDESFTLHLFMTDSQKTTLILQNIPQELIVDRLFNMTGKVMLDLSETLRNPLYLPRLPAHYERDLASFSLALLSYKSWDKFYGSMADYAREWNLTQYSLELPVLSAMDQMERELGRCGESNMRVFAGIWQTIMANYSVDYSSTQLFSFAPAEEAYLYLPELWAKPLSSVYRAVSLIQTLASFPFRRYNHTLEENLVRFLNLENRKNPLARAMMAGYLSPFTNETFRKATFLLSDQLGL
jgi:hypothetical protein